MIRKKCALLLLVSMSSVLIGWCKGSGTRCGTAIGQPCANSPIKPLFETQAVKLYVNANNLIRTADAVKISVARSLRQAQDAADGNTCERRRPNTFTALVAVGTSQIVSQAYNLSPTQVVHGLPTVDVSNSVIGRDCEYSDPVEQCVPGRYRSYDGKPMNCAGSCNNVRNATWGASLNIMSRFTPPEYGDYVSDYRRSRTGQGLPGPGLIEYNLFSSTPAPSRHASLMFVAWAGLVSNDMLLRTDMFGHIRGAIDCCKNGGTLSYPECTPLRVFAADGSQRCLPYSRTGLATRDYCGLGPREQANTATSYLDGSNIYGLSDVDQKRRRSFTNGKIKTPAADPPCHVQVAEYPAITALQSVMHKQHNYVATQLKIVNPHWNDERVFQESRRVLIAQIQHITYNEYLPLAIGREKAYTYGLKPQPIGYYGDYNIDVDASVLNEFSAIFTPIALSMLNGYITLHEKEPGTSFRVDLQTLFANPGSIFANPDNLTKLLRSLFRDPANKSGLRMAPVFKTAPVSAAAFLIQLGRDHGIPGYTSIRHACGLSVPRTFDELRTLVDDPATVQQLRNIYSHVDDIDLVVMALAEASLPGAVHGPTAACIVAHQFARARQGDRFWYENFFAGSAFQFDQLMEIRKTKLSRLMCENTDDLGDIQPYAMLNEDLFENCALTCSNAMIGEQIDWAKWRDGDQSLVMPITAEIIQRAVIIAEERIRIEIEQEIRLLAAQYREGQTPSSILRPGDYALDLSIRSKLMLEITTVILSRNVIAGSALSLPPGLSNEQLMELMPHVNIDEIIPALTLGHKPKSECVYQPEPCDPTSPYRSATGWCNNLNYPKFGNAFTPQRRLLPAAYQDGFNEPRSRSVLGGGLPSPRLISNVVHSIDNRPHVQFTHMTMQFGQFLDHDITLSPISGGPNGEHLSCSRCDSAVTESPHCFPIRIPSDDAHFDSVNSLGQPQCLPFVRSLVGQTRMGYRNQMNTLTSFIDLSNVYGSTDCEFKRLRLHRDGMLNYTQPVNTAHGQLLPQEGPDAREMCRDKLNCFMAGDLRANEHPGLASMHTIWLRQHNQLAEGLKSLNPHWEDDRLFQEAKRISSAIMQHIVYNEFLPAVLGLRNMDRHGLQPQYNDYFNGYDSSCDAGMSNAFAGAAYRFGHTLIRDDMPLMTDSGASSGTLPFQTNFFNATSVYLMLDQILIGLVRSPAQAFDVHLAQSVRLHLFEETGKPKSGMDLAAINIQRGRDHGLPGYNKFREWCGHGRASDFKDLRNTTASHIITAMKSVYRHVDDIDLFTGLMAEQPLRGALVGATTSCILAEQFERLKKCDRFFYENSNAAVRFTRGQLMEIRKMTLAKVMCASIQGMNKVQPRVFDVEDQLNNMPIPCDMVPNIDLFQWADTTSSCEINNERVSVGTVKEVSPCMACVCTHQGPLCHNIRVNCYALVDKFDRENNLAALWKDTSCVIQCSSQIQLRLAAARG